MARTLMAVPPEPSRARWTVSQIGAREHYAVPRGLARRRVLERLYTDAWCYSGARWLRHAPSLLRGFAGRRSGEIDDGMVTAFNARAFREALRRPAPTNEVLHRRFVRIGEDFARRVTRALAACPPRAERDLFFGFDTGSLESLEWLSERQVFTVLDQIDPAQEEERIVRAEVERWPGWERVPGPIPLSYFARLRAEWDAASLVLVNSPWSRDALLKQGVPAGKVAVVPCGYDAPSYAAPRVPRREGTLRVLWLGTANLRKGIAYLLEAARLLRGSDVHFRVVGPIAISSDAVASAPPSVTFEGPVPRTGIGEAYREADVFVFPTLSDGFGMTQLEAMGHGLPVIATPNCGEVVTHEREGLIVPAGDGPALAAAIARLDADRGLLAAMSRQAALKVRQFSIDEATSALLGAVATAGKSVGAVHPEPR